MASSYWWYLSVLLLTAPDVGCADVLELDGELYVHVHHTIDAEVTSYALRLDRDDTIRPLIFPAILPGYIGSGSKLTVRVNSAAHGQRSSLGIGQEGQMHQGGSHTDAASAPTLYVTDFDVREVGPGKDFPVTDTTVDLHSITWVLNLCGNTNSATAASVRAKWFDEGVAAQAPTMEGYHKECSYGKVSFKPQNNVVVGPINVPCTGTMTGGFAYSGSTCGSTDIYAWAEYAENYTRSVLNMSITSFTRRILMLPDRQPCAWAGLGSVGCGTYCYTWVLSPYALNLATTFHELGHNLGLQHSTTLTDEYGDHSCAMGSATNVRCFNAPQMWRLGWATAQVTYDMASGFGPGVWHSHAVMADAVSATTMIRVVTPSAAFFVSYRQPLLYDTDLQPPYRDRVFVHRFNGSIGLLSRDKPQLQTLSGLISGQTYSDADGGWRVTVTSIDGNSTLATVTLCRFTCDVEVDCTNGLDDDCNGLTDAADPACHHPHLLAPPVPAPPPPPASVPSPPPPLPTSASPPRRPPAVKTVCGDGVCDASGGETKMSCPKDCCPHQCGDGTCDTYAEDCHSCPADCRVAHSGICCGGAALCARGGCGACSKTCAV